MSIKTVTATINGQRYNLTWDAATSSYKATITAPAKSSFNNNAEHYYPVSVSATDDANNTTTVNDQDAAFGINLKLRVIEKVKPTITVTSPTDSSTIINSAPTITWKVADDDSGINPDTISIKIDSGVAVTADITKTKTSTGYDCSYTVPSALSDGTHSFTLDVSDNDGNAATAVATSFIVDTTPPTLTVSAPSNNLITNNAKINVTGTTNDALSTPVTLTINGESVPVDSDGSFTYTVTLTEGKNTITVVATDAAGKSSTVVRNVTLDTGAPVFTEISITPNPVDAGQTYIITVKVTD